jgi:hypothetical protein
LFFFSGFDKRVVAFSEQGEACVVTTEEVGEVVDDEEEEMTMMMVIRNRTRKG